MDSNRQESSTKENNFVILSCGFVINLNQSEPLEMESDLPGEI